MDLDALERSLVSELLLHKAVTPDAIASYLQSNPGVLQLDFQAMQDRLTGDLGATPQELDAAINALPSDTLDQLTGASSSTQDGAAPPADPNALPGQVPPEAQPSIPPTPEREVAPERRPMNGLYWLARVQHPEALLDLWNVKDKEHQDLLDAAEARRAHLVELGYLKPNAYVDMPVVEVEDEVEVPPETSGEETGIPGPPDGQESGQGDISTSEALDPNQAGKPTDGSDEEDPKKKKFNPNWSKTSKAFPPKNLPPQTSRPPFQGAGAESFAAPEPLKVADEDITKLIALGLLAGGLAKLSALGMQAASPTEFKEASRRVAQGWDGEAAWKEEPTDGEKGPVPPQFKKRIGGAGSPAFQAGFRAEQARQQGRDGESAAADERFESQVQSAMRSVASGEKLGFRDKFKYGHALAEAKLRISEGKEPTSGETLGGSNWDESQHPRDEQGKFANKAAYVVVKSSDEKRFTLGPFYIPDRLDAHDEFTTPDTLQEGIWDYVRKGKRDIMLQHGRRRAGEWVELMAWPYATEVEMQLPGMAKGVMRKATLPAGTAYMGVVWEPWAWEKVKRGELRGLSMGGFAHRVEVDFVQKFSEDQPRDESGKWSSGGGSSSGGTSSGSGRVTASGHRPLSTIASDIKRDWGSKVNFAAKPYLDAMGQLNDVKDNYYADSAKSVVSYFLSNASSWRGDVAREVKSELKDIVAGKTTVGSGGSYTPEEDSQQARLETQAENAWLDVAEYDPEAAGGGDRTMWTDPNAEFDEGYDPYGKAAVPPFFVGSWDDDETLVTIEGVTLTVKDARRAIEVELEDLLKFSADQPRDDGGRFASGAGDAADDARLTTVLPGMTKPIVALTSEERAFILSIVPPSDKSEVERIVDFFRQTALAGVAKYNENHDKEGKFSSSREGASAQVLGSENKVVEAMVTGLASLSPKEMNRLSEKIRHDDEKHDRKVWKKLLALGIVGGGDF
jgi:hypothetical protein